MACECISQMDKALEEHNTCIAPTIIFAKPTYVAVTIMTEVVKKARGARPKVVLPTFCPFCGTRYVEEKAG